MFTQAQSHEIAKLAKAGKPIDAIKLIKDWLRCNLKQAKDFYEVFVCGMYANKAAKK
jgi:ribosomal protein L7/L12